jgi:hypothetical protein
MKQKPNRPDDEDNDDDDEAQNIACTMLDLFLPNYVYACMSRYAVRAPCAAEPIQ